MDKALPRQAQLGELLGIALVIIQDALQLLIGSGVAGSQALAETQQSWERFEPGQESVELVGFGFPQAEDVLTIQRTGKLHKPAVLEHGGEQLALSQQAFATVHDALSASECVQKREGGYFPAEGDAGIFRVAEFR
ncbi:hypothetical protein HRbin36_02172 [bacterium HR36]|nr:hypothetical protein HRbin36_02172 [bacterium HR36]